MNYIWVSFICKLDQKEKERITLQTEGEKQMSVSAGDRSFEHDDYDNRRRANCNDDQRRMLMGR